LSDDARLLCHFVFGSLRALAPNQASGQIVAAEVVQVQVVSNAHGSGGPAYDGAAFPDLFTRFEGVGGDLIPNGQVCLQHNRYPVDKDRFASSQWANSNKTVVVGM
jgi:hypothetical protein